MIRWKKIRYRLEYFGLLLLGSLVQKLSLAWLHFLGRLLGSAFFSLDRHRREVTLANLKIVFGKTYSEQRLRQIGCQSYVTFATTALELLWSPNLTPAVVDKIATFEGLDAVLAYQAQGVPLIYCCLHAGNFEWVAQLTSRHTSFFPLIAQKFKNPYLGPLFDGWRSSMGNPIIPQKNAMLKMLRHLKKGGAMGLLIDLNLKPQQGPVVIRCFQKLLTPVTPLPAELALRTGALLIPVECLLRSSGGYHIRYLPAIKISDESTPTTIAQASWDALEPNILKHPEYWLWSYKHWRYRPSGVEEKEYPFYANVFDQFDALLEK